MRYYKCVCVLFYFLFHFLPAAHGYYDCYYQTREVCLSLPPLSLLSLYSLSNSRITEAPPISPAHPMSESDSSGSSSSSDSSSDSSDCDEDNEQGQEKRGGRLPEAPLPMEEEDHAWEKVGMKLRFVYLTQLCVYNMYTHSVHTHIAYNVSWYNVVYSRLNWYVRIR